MLKNAVVGPAGGREINYYNVMWRWCGGDAPIGIIGRFPVRPAPFPRECRGLSWVTRAAIAGAALMVAGCIPSSGQDARQDARKDKPAVEFRQIHRIPSVASIYLLTDNENGCQYLVIEWKDFSIAPRLGPDGKIICRSEARP